MNSYSQVKKWAGLLTFLIISIVYFFSVERTGSLWDCGEFIAGAYKLQVVHPPGAPLFILVGRIFTLLPEWFSDNPANIAFSVNMMSGIFGAITATCVAWIAIIMGRLTLNIKEDAIETSTFIALFFTGLVAGLATGFSTSIWFSAVEGEVYSMSTAMMALGLWLTVKWYEIPNDDKNADRWLILAIFVVSLSMGVHLLSLLVFPALTVMYYLKKYKERTMIGFVWALVAGMGFIVFTMKGLIVGIPTIWSCFDVFMVNSLGLPPNSGIIPTIILIGVIYFFLFKAVMKRGALAQNLLVAAFLCTVSFSTYGVVVIRANANTPINMNKPSDPHRLLPYVNREQYGSRPLISGPDFSARPNSVSKEDRYGIVEKKLPNGDIERKYEIVDVKSSYEYAAKDKKFFPRMGDNTQNRERYYKADWMGLDPNKPLPAGRPSFGDNISYFVRYQLGWMYWRYFFWNFSGRQNGEQGYTPANVKNGNWVSGIKMIDDARLYDSSKMPERMRNEESYNTYFLLPFIFGIIGLVFHFMKRKEEFYSLLFIFLLTGIGLIVYSNQPPHEPRERDYVLVGSFFVFCIWIGMGVLALFKLFAERFKLAKSVAAPIAGVLILSAPLLMGFQNFDDHSRMNLSGARDYANNFLQSCEPNAIIFTLGDNDTYPLWYAQEVENIRPDVRVVNLSLIQVDWYINQMRRKVNDSEAIKLTVPEHQIRGSKRNQILINTQNSDRMDAIQALTFVGEDHPQRNGLLSYLPAKNLRINTDRDKQISLGNISASDTSYTGTMDFTIDRKQIFKGDLAVLDIVASNINDRPIYFAVTCQPSSTLGLENFTRLEGLGLRVIPKKTTNDASGRGIGMAGKGTVDAEKTLRLFKEEFKWGNFDKEKMFVDESFAPSIQYLRLVALRAAKKFIEIGEKEKAVEMVDAYYKGFPVMNFRRDFSHLQFLTVYGNSGEKEKLRSEIDDWSKELVEYLTFYETLGAGASSFGREMNADIAIARNLINLSRNVDESFAQEISDKLSKYVTE